MNKIKAVIAPVIEEAGKFVETAKDQVTLSEESQKANSDTKKLVEDIYKPGEETSPDEIVKQKAEDKKKEAQLRQILHQEYVSTLQGPRKKEEPKAEELERKKDEERWELDQKEKKKPPPLAIQRSQNIEKHRGSAG